jgi:hypothetical protein
LTRALARPTSGLAPSTNYFSTKSELCEAAVADVLEGLGELLDRLSVDVEDAATAFAQSGWYGCVGVARRFPRCSSGRGCTVPRQGGGG